MIGRLWLAVGDKEHALTAVDQALNVVTGENYPDAPLRALRGEILEKLGRTEEASRSLQDAGDRYLWRNEAAEAVRLLQSAIDVDAGNVEAHWSLADALLNASYSAESSTAERLTLVERARTVWNDGCGACDVHGVSYSVGIASAARASLRSRE